VIDHFEYNLRRMVEMAREAGVPVLLMNPVSNLDTPPFKSEHRAGMTAGELTQFDRLWEEARESYSRNLVDASVALKRAIALDDQHAGIHFTLGKCYEDLGRFEEARAELILAKDLDICPLRILEPMSQAILDLARTTRGAHLDLVKFFAAKSRGGITGYDWLVDHVHPSIIGHQLIANLLADEMVRLGYVHPGPGWFAERDRLYRQNLDSLDDFYYLMGEKRLENLRLWSVGRGNRTRPLSSAPRGTMAPDRPIGGPQPGASSK
jgi:hypothetical protein